MFKLAAQTLESIKTCQIVQKNKNKNKNKKMGNCSNIAADSVAPSKAYILSVSDL